MAAKCGEQIPASFDVQTITEGLREARAYPVTMYGGDYCTMHPGKVYPLGWQASKGRSVRQRLLSVLQPPEGLFGIVASEVNDNYCHERRVGLYLSRLAIGGRPAEVGALLQPGEIVQIESSETGGQISWATGVGLGLEGEDVLLMHAGAGRATVFAAPVEKDEPMIVPDTALWAPNAAEVFTAFTATGKA